MDELRRHRELLSNELDSVSGGSNPLTDLVETVLDGIDGALGGSKTVECLQNKIDPYWRRT